MSFKDCGRQLSSRATHPRLVELVAHQRRLVVKNLDAEDWPLTSLLVNAATAALKQAIQGLAVEWRVVVCEKRGDGWGKGSRIESEHGCVQRLRRRRTPRSVALKSLAGVQVRGSMQYMYGVKPWT